jgi:antirestriction protein ArdC
MKENTVAANAMIKFTDLILNELEEAEKSGNFSWIRPWRTLDSCYRNNFTGNVYKGLHNILICSFSKYTDSRYASFNQINNAGGRVKKGAKATCLLAWNITQTDEIDKKTGNTKKKNLIFCKNVCVFNMEETENLILEPINNIFNDDVKPSVIVENLVKKFHINLTYKASNKAFYDNIDDSITMPLSSQFSSSDEFANVCLHEIVHWTAKRVDRDCKNYHFDIEERAMEELVAELGSMFLCKNFKINGFMNKNNLAYIKSWKDAARGKNGNNFIYKACSLAEKACKYLIGDEINVKSETEAA